MDSRERRTLAQRRAATLSALLTQYPTERIEQLAGDLNVKRLMEAWEGVLDMAQYLNAEEVNNLCRVMVLIGYILGHETALCYDKMVWFEGVAG
jgi:hypothetical protein